MAKDATEGGARNAWQDAVIDRLPLDDWTEDEGRAV